MSEPRPWKEHELETIRLMSDGKTAQEIAMITGRAKCTVITRIQRIKALAGVYKDTALVATALRKGWIQ